MTRATVWKMGSSAKFSVVPEDTTATMGIMLKLLGKEQTGSAATPAPSEALAFSPEDSNPAPTGAPPPLVGQNRKILVVDDNPVVLKAFEMKLRSKGFAVVTIANAEGVARAATETSADLIILDVHFASNVGVEWTGVTIMQWLRRFPETVDIPVVLVSGVEAAEYGDQALKAGAVAFFQKPVRFSELLATITQALKLETPANPPAPPESAPLAPSI